MALGHFRCTPMARTGLRRLDLWCWCARRQVPRPCRQYSCGLASDLEFSGSERARFEAAPFLVRNGRRSFYSTICSTSRPFVRFDEECMVPQDASGKTSARLIAQRAKDVGFTSVHWRAGEVLLIDNWNVLHGRGLATPVASSDRKLFRVSVQ